MAAFRLPGWGVPARFEDVAVPVPVGREVLVRVASAGLCASDLHLMDASPGARPYPVPFTLGHECAGHVVTSGPEADAPAPGSAVVVYAPLGCGQCRNCRRGAVNYCTARSQSDPLALGIGADGAMAEYMLVPDAAQLIPIGGLNLVMAAALADAASTAHHAVASCLPHLAGDATALVIGVGGLGHAAIQLLRALSSCRIAAVDSRESALVHAEALGAHEIIRAGPRAASLVRSMVGGAVDVVLDFVGSDDTMRFTAEVISAGSRWVVVGSGGGSVVVAKNIGLPRGIEVWQPYWGTRSDLAQVVTLAAAGTLHLDVEPMPLRDVHGAIARLRQGEVTGRIGLVPAY